MSGAALLAGLAAALGVLALGEAVRLCPRRRRLARAGRVRAGWRRLAARTGLPAPPPGLAARVAAAGPPAGIGVREVMALKCALAPAVLLAALTPAALLPSRAGTLVLLLAPAAGFAAPDLALARRARRRACALRAEAPAVLDRLRLAVEAGLAPGAALEHAARDGRGPLSAELRAAGAAIACGAGRAAALERLRARCPAPEVHALAAALARADRHGAPLGPALTALAEGARAERTRRVRERAQRAAPKIQLAVALLLVPAALLLIAAGLVAGLA
ncbi:MAG: type II secretion system F family protein [Solirubrobacteraceae bacterium]|nr:type II secretion system F family protein [Solirubrobacteraceae bacterium]